MARRISSVLTTTIVLFAAALPARGQDLDRVRALYISAAYEEALAMMPAVGVTTVTRDIEQYRALCLLALGREKEAVESVERMVQESPTFVPPRSETSPRMQAIFADVRSRLVPEIAKRSYAEAKAAYEAKNLDAARSGFRRTMELIDSVEAFEKRELADLRLLAGEFIELSAIRPAPSPATPATALAKEGLSLVPNSGAYVGPTVIREQLPPWNPPDVAARRSEYVGVLRVHIGENGRVVGAAVVKTSHPAYDALVVSAARQWVYQPATRGGKPVSAERDIQIRLVPR